MSNGKRKEVGIIFVLVLVLSGCGGQLPDDLGARSGRLIDCPESPNCVSSFATDETHGIDALRLEAGGAEAMEALVKDLESRERVEIIRKDSGYVQAVFTTALMRYRDDVEFLLRAPEGEIAVRSASRVGYGDMDANRNRIESIRAALAEQGVVAAASTE